MFVDGCVVVDNLLADKIAAADGNGAGGYCCSPWSFFGVREVLFVLDGGGRDGSTPYSRSDPRLVTLYLAVSK